jgi:hypothetical protein
MSFIFHPTIIRGSQPNLVLQELKSYKVLLDESPLMNALFSPSSVPIPSSHAVWPSKYEAQKYLPPIQKYVAPQARYQLQHPQLFQVQYSQQHDTDDPVFRRAVVQINGDGIDSFHPNIRNSVSEMVQESIAKNAAALKNVNQGKRLRIILVNKLNYFLQAFQQSSDALNHFFNKQLHIPQFSGIGITQQFQTNVDGNHNSGSVTQGQLPSTFQNSFPQFPQLEAFSQMPYISPNLRRPDKKDSMEDIDVRMDKRTDTVVSNENVVNSQEEASVIQIGNGNKNVSPSSFTNDKNGEENQKIIEVVKNNETSYLHDDEVDLVEIKSESDQDLQPKIQHDQIRLTVLGSEGEKVEKIEETTASRNDDETTSESSDENDKFDGIAVMNLIKDDNSTEIESKLILTTIVPDIFDEFTTLMQSGTLLEEQPETTTIQNVSEEGTTESSTDETTTSKIILEERLELNAIKSLVG